jgi:periplasmic protein TonB
MAAVAITTALAILAFKLPLGSGPGRVGWQVVTTEQIIALEEVRFEEGLSRLAGTSYSEAVPAIKTSTGPETPVEDVPPDTSSVSSGGADSQQSSSKRRKQLAPLVLAAAETMPQIEGGLGAYYINIVYPRDAINAGVEGRLVLDFVVEPDGRTSRIEVYSSLHPLCDSAAVRALRKTLFMPGRNGGEAVAVKMRLPVLFRIQDAGKSRADADSARTELDPP